MWNVLSKQFWYANITVRDGIPDTDPNCEAVLLDAPVACGRVIHSKQGGFSDQMLWLMQHQDGDRVWFAWVLKEQVKYAS